MPEIITVIAAVPDAGATFTASNVAAWLSQNAKTLLIDLSCRGILGELFLSEAAKETVYPTTITWREYQGEFLLTTKFGLSVLPGPIQEAEGQEKASCQIDELINNYAYFDFIVIDAGGDIFLPYIDSAMAVSNMTVLVAEPSQRCLQAIPDHKRRELNQKSNLRLVVNRVSKGAYYHPRDVARWFGFEEYLEIPDDPIGAKVAIKRRLPQVLNGKGKAYSSLCQLSKDLFNTSSFSLSEEEEELHVEQQQQSTSADSVVDMSQMPKGIKDRIGNIFCLLKSFFKHKRNSKDRLFVPEMKEDGGETNSREQIKTLGASKSIEQSNIDELTGCYTRRVLQDYRPIGAYVAVFIDLDKFKPINDILGHAAGDRVLATFGKVLMANLKGQDLAVRYGGDEFLLILPNTSPKGAEKVVSNLRAAWERDAPDTGNLKVGFSAGIAAGEGYDDLPEAIKAADRAMYAEKVKCAGRISDADVRGVQPAASIQPLTLLQPLGTSLQKEKESVFQMMGQVFGGLFNVLGVMIIFSMGVWIINYFLNLIGKSSSTLNTTAKFVTEFWQMLFTGLFG
ncbi:MAG: diguanylate cyclase [Bacillota bacterium]